VERGEALIQVGRDARRPLVVLAGDLLQLGGPNDGR
jgi:ferric-dicitrate binding protein FerR (iron transport regulator)